jgi:hypothetical protein
VNQPEDVRQRPRTVLVAACSVSILLAVASLSWWYAASRARDVVSLHSVHGAATPVAVSDCPPTVACQLEGTVRPAVLALVRARLGPHSVIGSSAVVDVRSGQRYEELVRARVAPGVEVQVTTRCVSGSATPVSRAPSSIPAKGPASLAAVVAGRGGCSAAVTMQVSKGIAVPWTGAAGLVEEPRLQLE